MPRHCAYCQLPLIIPHSSCGCAGRTYYCSEHTDWEMSQCMSCHETIRHSWFGVPYVLRREQSFRITPLAVMWDILWFMVLYRIVSSSDLWTNSLTFEESLGYALGTLSACTLTFYVTSHSVVFRKHSGAFSILAALSVYLAVFLFCLCILLAVTYGLGSALIVKLQVNVFQYPFVLGSYAMLLVLLLLVCAYVSIKLFVYSS